MAVSGSATVVVVVDVVVVLVEVVVDVVVEVVVEVVVVVVVVMIERRSGQPMSRKHKPNVIRRAIFVLMTFPLCVLDSSIC